MTEHRPVPSPRYKRAPIAECIIEMRVAERLDDSLVEKISSRFQSKYPSTTPMIGLPEITIDTTGGSVAIATPQQGRRLASEDGADVVLITPEFLSTARLPPYPGWGEFFARARENWQQWVDIAGKRQLVRVGVRYINRIDIPNPEGGPLNLDDYLTFQARSEAFDLPIAGYYVLTTLNLHQWRPDWLANVQSTITAPQVPGSVSIILDIDVHRLTTLPVPDADPCPLIEATREIKNDIFQRALTAKAKELFDR